MNSLIDTSVFVGHWPFQPLQYHSPTELKQFLCEQKVVQAWVTSADAILFPDPMQANEPLLAAVANDTFFVPVVVINPTLATWKHDLQICIHNGAKAIKLFPNYHQYRLTDPVVAELMVAAQQANLPVCVQMRMVDERAHHPLMKVPGVPVAALATLAQEHPNVRFLACCIFQAELSRLAGLSNVWAEISYIESGETLPAIVKILGASQLVFGSHSPFLYFAAETGKLVVDPAQVTEATIEQITVTNAQVLLGVAVK